MLIFPSPYVVAAGGGGPTFVASTNGVVANDWNITLNTPTGVQDGDLLVFQVSVYDGTDLITPTGWTLLDEEAWSGSSTTLWTFHRIASSQGATQQIATVGSAYKSLRGIFTAWRDAQIGNWAAANSLATSQATGTLTATAGSALLNTWVGSQAITMPGAGTLLANIGASLNYMGAEYETGLAGGTTTARTATAGSSSGWACHSIEIQGA